MKRMSIMVRDNISIVLMNNKFRLGKFLQVSSPKQKLNQLMLHSPTLQSIGIEVANEYFDKLEPGWELMRFGNL